MSVIMVDNQFGDDEAELNPRPRFINFTSWDNEPMPEHGWAVRERIPSRQASLFGGEGGSGKGHVTLHLCCAHPLGKDWLGSMPEPGASFFIDAEDDENEIHIRLGAIARHYGVTYGDLHRGGLHLMSLAGRDAVMAAPNRNGKIEATKLYDHILDAAYDIRPKMIAISSTANIFAGKENERSQVQQFIGLMTKLAIAADGAVMLISHPSLTGISSDSGLSGSTAWHNSVRSRIYMKGVKAEDGDLEDLDMRELHFKKNQYGSLADRVVLKYRDGMFLPVPGMASLDKLAHQTKAQQVFLDLLVRFTREGRNVSANPGRGYAPSAFAGETEAKAAHLSSRDLKDALRQLFQDGKIENQSYGRASHLHYRLAIKA
jgi:RecA-family ATPase